MPLKVMLGHPKKKKSWCLQASHAALIDIKVPSSPFSLCLIRLSRARAQIFERVLELAPLPHTRPRTGEEVHVWK